MNQFSIAEDSPVTIVAAHRVKPGKAKAFERAMSHLIQAAIAFEGHCPWNQCSIHGITLNLLILGEIAMEMRFLSKSGLKVSILSFGTMTFGGGDNFFQQMGGTQLDEAQRLVDICLDAGVNFFDTADAYSQGKSEEILGKALGKRRQDVILSTKAFNRMGDGAEDDVNDEASHMNCSG